MRRKSGITLVALVITIIVLLKLAGVSISLVVGDNGVLTKAKIASEKVNSQSALEELQIAYSAVLMRYYGECANNASLTKSEYITRERLQEELNGFGTISSFSQNSTTNEIEIKYESNGKNAPCYATILLDGSLQNIEYEWVDYIASAGKESIDTGIPGNNNNLSLEVQYQWVTLPNNSEYRAVISSWVNESSVDFRILQFGSSKTYYAVNSKAGASMGYDLTRDTDTIYTEKLYNSETTFTVVATDGTENVRAKIDATDNSSNIHIFSYPSRNLSNCSSIKLYYLKIWDDGTLIRDFAPCYRKPDNVYGLYDKVNGVFYKNASSTGEFVGGQL